MWLAFLMSLGFWLWPNLQMVSNQALRWHLANCNGQNILSISKQGFIFIILQCVFFSLVVASIQHGS
jgi:hypothetical protein